jgi:hypothetical protein
MGDGGWVRFFDLHILCRWPLTPALPPFGGGREKRWPFPYCRSAMAIGFVFLFCMFCGLVWAEADDRHRYLRLPGNYWVRFFVWMFFEPRMDTK